MEIYIVENRIGLFGGRFDPVHRAHVSMAIAAANQLKLDEIRWIVTGKPVHKKTYASAKHRLQMVSLVLKDLSDERMKLDSMEVLASYQGLSNPTYKTLELLKIEHPNKEFLWILGEDQFVNFRNWRNWEWLIKNMKIAVCARPSQLESTKNSFFLTQKLLIKEEEKRLVWIEMHSDDCSSTKIRELISRGYSPTDLVGSSVEKYILENKLYKSLEGEQ